MLLKEKFEISMLKMKPSYLITYEKDPVFEKIYENTDFFLRLGDQVSIGDEVLVQENEALFPAKVVDMSSSRMQGDYTKDLKLFSFLIYFVMFFEQCSFML